MADDDKHEELDAVLRAAARRSAKIIRPEPDCRTCAHFDCISLGCHADRCDGVNMYQPLPPVRLWRTT